MQPISAAPHTASKIVSRRSDRARLHTARWLAIGLLACSLGGCLGYDGEVSHGFQADPQVLADVKTGSSAEQVLVLLGTPSTTSTVGGDAWYYISQKTSRSLAFMPAKLVDQRIVAVYFDKTKKVTRLANYGLDDGKVVDFSSSSTPTSGAEGTFLKNMILNLAKFG